jgi:serine/threonine protein kinase
LRFRLGPYEVLAKLGEGGMGEVYKARDVRLDRTVAIKILPAELSADPERRTRFEREASAVAALSHPRTSTASSTATRSPAT